MAITSMDTFYDSALFDSNTGILTLSSLMSGETGQVNTIKQFDFNSASNTPTIIDNAIKLPDVAIDGSYCRMINGDVYYRTNGRWICTLKNRSVRPLRVPEYDSSVSYERGSIVHGNRSIMVATKNMTTTSVDIDHVQYVLTLENNHIVTTGSVLGITGISRFDRENLMLTTRFGIFKRNIDTGDVLPINNNIAGSSEPMKTYGSVVARKIDERMIKIIDIISNEPVSICMLEEGHTIDAFDLYESKLYMLCSATNTMYIADILTGRIMDQLQLLSDYMSSNIKVSIFNGYIYILKDNNILYMINLIDGIIVAQAEIHTESSGFSDEEAGGFGLPGEEGQEDSQPTLHDIAKIGDNLYFIKGESRSVYVSQIDIREWKPMTVDDIFARSSCAAAFNIVFYYTNIVVNSSYSYIPEARDVAFIDNKTGAYINETHVGFIDIEEGVFSHKILPEKQQIGSLHIGGITAFKGEFVIGRGKDLITVSKETRDVIEVIHIASKIEDYDILSISGRGDTLYVLTTLGKIYMFDDVHSDVSGVVQLAQFNADMSRICVLDAERVYVSHIADSDHFIYEMSLTDGAIIAKSSISRENMIAMDMLFEEFYTLDIGGTGILINWKKQKRKVEI
jgi:hypothetical protein